MGTGEAYMGGLGGLPARGWVLWWRRLWLLGVRLFEELPAGRCYFSALRSTWCIPCVVGRVYRQASRLNVQHWGRLRERNGSHVTRATPAPNECRNTKMYSTVRYAWPALLHLFDQATYHGQGD